MPFSKVHIRAQRRRGFTLIELMVVVAVVAIVSAIAMPSFMSQVKASRRSEAIAALSQVQQVQESWRSNCPCYASSLTAANTGCPATTCATASGLGLSLNTSRYNYALSVAPSASAPNSYTITATGLAGQATDRAVGASCSVLTVAVASGVATNSPASCWRQ